MFIYLIKIKISINTRLIKLDIAKLSILNSKILNFKAVDFRVTNIKIINFKIIRPNKAEFNKIILLLLVTKIFFAYF